jgi:ribosomal-protein-serine acetyltransferase
VIQTSVQSVASFAVPPSATVVTTNWQNALPVIVAGGVTLRELRVADAPTLLAMLHTEEVSRFVWPPPSSVSGFERFILWTQRERAAGRFVCFGIIPQGHEHAVGIIQVRPLAAGVDVAEWGFAIGSSFWGRGVFPVAARGVMAFAFDTLRAHRLEARSAVDNGRGNGALQKVGATREGVLRKSFRREGAYYDQVIWSICAEDWRQWHCAPTRMSH